MRGKIVLGAMLLTLVTGAGATNETLLVGRFSADDLTDWQPKSFKGETRYTFDGKSGRRALFADSRGTASGLYREIRLDLRRNANEAAPAPQNPEPWFYRWTRK